MEPSDVLRSACTLLDLPPSSQSTRSTLIERIAALLTHQPERLMSILYRIDVNEERINHIFATAPVDRIAEEIADAIIERIALKHHLRMHHKQSTTPQNVRLRPFTATDAPMLYEAVTESFEQLHQWLAWCHDSYSIEDAYTWCAHAASELARQTAFHFAVEVQNDTKWVLAGGCGIARTHDHHNNVGELGYWTRTALTGRGIATTAAQQMVMMAFNQFGFERIEIIVATPNKASQHVAEKLGAQREAVLRSRIAVGTKRYDAFLYSILRSQWQLAS